MMGATIRPLAAAALIAFGAAIPAVAAETFSVDYSGIDLTSSIGRDALQRRVEQKINSVCGMPVLFDRAEAAALRDCRDATRADVAPQVRAVLTRATISVAEQN